LLCFYEGDQRSGRSYETWCGTLSPMTIDVAAMEAAPAPPAAIPAPLSNSIRGPQFAGATRATIARGY
jgi:hypothetical protein